MIEGMVDHPPILNMQMIWILNDKWYAQKLCHRMAIHASFTTYCKVCVQPLEV